MRPLLEKVDVVQYTNRLRTLKVAEEYAVRLLAPHCAEDQAKRMARHLVEKYPEHGFVIDFEEAKKMGLPVKEPTPEQNMILDKILLHLRSVKGAVGKVEVRS